MTMDFSELAPVVTAWRGSRAQDLPIEFGGRAKFQGTVLGRLARPALAGHLELHDFTTLLRRQEKPVAGAAPAERVVRTRWELLEGDVEYSATHESLRNGVLRHGGARIGLDGSVALANGSYDASQPFSAHVKVENAEAGELQGLVGSNYPVSGQVSGDVHVEGTESHLSGSGRICHERWKRMASGGAFGDRRGELHGESGTVAQHRGEKRRDATERRCADQCADQRIWL